MRVVLVGAANPETGRQLAAARAADPSLDVVGFLDNDPAKWGTTFLGLPVLGGFAHLDDLDLDPADTRFVNLVTGSTRARRETTLALLERGFAAADLRDPRKADAVARIINARLAECQKTHPGGYLVREAPAEDLKQLKILAGHLKEGQFVTKFRKTFAKDEMDDDLLIVPARVNKAEDWSEYEEILPTSPP